MLEKVTVKKKKKLDLHFFLKSKYNFFHCNKFILKSSKNVERKIIYLYIYFKK